MAAMISGATGAALSLAKFMLGDSWTEWLGPIEVVHEPIDRDGARTEPDQRQQDENPIGVHSPDVGHQIDHHQDRKDNEAQRCKSRGKADCKTNRQYEFCITEYVGCRGRWDRKRGVLGLKQLQGCVLDVDWQHDGKIRNAAEGPQWNYRSIDHALTRLEEIAGHDEPHPKPDRRIGKKPAQRDQLADDPGDDRTRTRLR